MNLGAKGKWIAAARSACLALVAWSVASAGRAEDQLPTGTYQASPATIRSEVSAWGPDCGVKPQSYVTREQPRVVVGAAGAHLMLRFPDRTMRTDRCWSPNPAVKLATTSASDTRFRSECRTPRGDPKQEVGRYTVSVTGPYTLELLEESDYDWQLNSSHCVAKVRITQQLSRVPEERTAKGATETATPASKEDACAVPSTPTRLRLRPSEARIEPDQRVCFTVLGVDARGCASDVELASLRWELKSPPAAQGSLAGGCFRSAEGAAAAEGEFLVLVRTGALRAEAKVVVAAPDLSDITARRGEAEPSPVRSQGLTATPTAAAVKAAGVRTRSHVGLLLGVGALLLGLIGGGVWLGLRRKARATGRPAARGERSSSAPTPPPKAHPSPAASAVTSGSAASQAGATREPTPILVAPGEQLICPTCRRGHPPGTSRCAHDGTPLVPYGEFIKQARQAEATQAAACGTCGAKLTPGSAFCGECGRRILG
jgi:hypothetical protein